MSDIRMYDVEMADFILPRLKDYYNAIAFCPEIIIYEYKEFDPIDKWKEIVHTMVQAFECTYTDSNLNLPEEQVEEGFRNFGKYFRCLW